MDDEERAAARREYKRQHQETRRRNAGVKPLRLAECGSAAAYRRHLRHGEPIDKLCRDNHNQRERDRRAKLKRKRRKK